jgi:hypothetical protein
MILGSVLSLPSRVRDSACPRSRGQGPEPFYRAQRHVVATVAQMRPHLGGTEPGDEPMLARAVRINSVPRHLDDRAPALGQHTHLRRVSPNPYRAGPRSCGSFRTRRDTRLERPASRPGLRWHGHDDVGRRRPGRGFVGDEPWCRWVASSLPCSEQSHVRCLDPLESSQRTDMATWSALRRPVTVTTETRWDVDVAIDILPAQGAILIRRHAHTVTCRT